MGKRLILDVDCLNEWYAEAPTASSVVVTQSLKDRVTQLSEVVDQLGVTSIEDEVFDTIVWGGENEEGDDVLSDHSLTPETLSAFIEKTQASVESVRLVVTGTMFYFTGIPKRLGEGSQLETSSVSISELESPDPVITV